jgi:hypothetical protein
VVPRRYLRLYLFALRLILYKERETFLAFLVVEEDFGLLVLLGFGITAFTPEAYLRSSLLRPYVEISSRG